MIDLFGKQTMRGDKDIRCTISKITNFLIFKRISCIADESGFVSGKNIAGGHVLTVSDWELKVFSGDQIHVWEPFWRRRRVGEAMMLSEIAQHLVSPRRFR